MLSDVIQTSETHKRITERRDRLLGEIGILDWQIKQLSARQVAKYNEIEAMLREQPFIQQLELDLIEKSRMQAEMVRQAVAGISQNETPRRVDCYETPFRAPSEPPGIPLEDLPRARGPRTPAGRMAEAQVAVERAPVRSRKKVARELTGAKRPAKKVTKQASAKKPATPKPVPVAAAPAEAPPSKRGRGRPRKHPPVAAVPPPEGVETAHPGNGANDLDAAFGAM
jgi:hypothetical protein